MISKEEWYKLHSDFINLFPLETLKQLPLEKYTNLKRDDSFCYWLEAVAHELGSIWGGNAYKFGIFKYDKKPKDNSNYFDEEYAWQNRFGSDKTEAYSKIIEGLCDIADAAAKGDFARVDSNKTYGDVCKWKIAFIYSGMNLIPVYSKPMLITVAKEYGMANADEATMIELQNFMLSKKGDKDLYDFYNEILALLDSINKEGKIWLIMGDASTLTHNTIKMGDSVSKELKDYSSFTSRKELGDAYRNIKGNTDVSVPYAYWQFINDVNVGDIVVVFSNKKQIGKNSHLMYGWGKFTSELINDPTSESPLQREVEWLGNCYDEPIQDTKTRNSIFFHGTTEEQAKHIKELLGIQTEETKEKDMSKIQEYIDLLRENHNLVLTGAPGTGKTYLAKEIAKAMNAEVVVEQTTGIDKQTIDENDILKYVHVGTEMTHHTRKDINYSVRKITNGVWLVNERMKREEGYFSDFHSIAEAYKNREWVHWGNHNYPKTIAKYIFDRICEENGVVIPETDCIKNYGFVQFHPSYDYTDFVEGLRPVKLNGSVGFELRDGSFKQFCKNAIDNSETDFVFIIDEINRGDLSKIFGELFFAIDPGYRGEIGKVNTQYQNMIDEEDVFADGFYVPENVYILATMNDIDRSVESMDFAMRRRFAWKEITPNDRLEMLEDLGAYKDEAIKRMQNLNIKIRFTKELGSAFQIGPAYFRKVKNGDFERLWTLYLKPLLCEYLRGVRNADSLLEDFEGAYNLKTIEL